MKHLDWKSVVIFFGVIVALSNAQAQTQSFTPFNLAQSSPAVTYAIDGNGTFSETGPLSSTPTFTFSSNPEMLWFPALGAFRAGLFSGNQSNVGQYSVAFGQNASATNTNALAFGFYSSATGSGSLAFNGGSATGPSSTAFGNHSFATNYAAVAFGSGCYATGQNSTAMGSSTNASGNASTTFGINTSAISYESVAIGQYNIGTGSTGSWVASDPVFEVGNGSQTFSNNILTTNRSDALVIYKNGNAVFGPPAGTATPPAGTPTCTVTAPAFVTSTPGGTGDIPMYTGN